MQDTPEARHEYLDRLRRQITDVITVRSEKVPDNAEYAARQEAANRHALIDSLRYIDANSEVVRDLYQLEYGPMPVAAPTLGERGQAAHHILHEMLWTFELENVEEQKLRGPSIAEEFLRRYRGRLQRAVNRLHVPEFDSPDNLAWDFDRDHVLLKARQQQRPLVIRIPGDALIDFRGTHDVSKDALFALTREHMDVIQKAATARVKAAAHEEDREFVLTEDDLKRAAQS